MNLQDQICQFVTKPNTISPENYLEHNACGIDLFLRGSHHIKVESTPKNNNNGFGVIF